MKYNQLKKLEINAFFSSKTPYNLLNIQYSTVSKRGCYLPIGPHTLNQMSTLKILLWSTVSKGDN